MSIADKKIKVVFAPGCFDGFEGTQEELDELIKEIQDLADSGELLEQGLPVELDGVTDAETAFGDLTDDELTEFIRSLNEGNDRNLQ